MVDISVVDQFLDDVSLPVSDLSGPQDSDEVRYGDWILAEPPSRSYLCDDELTEIVDNRRASQERGDIASVQTNSACVVSKTTREKKPPQRSLKDKLIELRESVADLTAQEEALKVEMQLPSQCSEAMTASSGSTMWKYAAIRQLERRQKSEKDNVRLRDI
ncbi:hypothetical protein AM587_10004843 [Phytophthora nicotianae]|uniref:Uncharacterized protein n=1 Tax=Phytophthora nicotianae TaxID=4792 RepID=A0A0W8CEE2_PHYNI|nr:hypothetical protein AM587_10004843 [Phytophthora nicotianae]